MAYNLRFEDETYGGYTPFIDSAHKHMIRGGLTIEAAWCRNNRIESQGQVELRNNRHWLLAGSVLCQEGVNGLWRVYTPAESAVAATLDLGDISPNEAIRITADAAGAAGNDIRVGIVDPGATSGAISVNVIGNKIEVTLAATGGSPTSDVDEVVGAINGDTAASALVTASVHPDATDGSGVMEAHDIQNLDGGADAVAENATAAEDVVLLWEDVDIQDGNAVATGLDHGRVITNRLPVIDAIAQARMPQIKFVEK